MSAEKYLPNARLAGVLFIMATTATIVSQVIVEPILDASDVGAAAQASRGLFSLGIMFEVINALASAGIGIALFPILRRAKVTAAVGYLSIRAIEGATGVFAAVAFI